MWIPYSMPFQKIKQENKGVMNGTPEIGGIYDYCN